MIIIYSTKLFAITIVVMSLKKAKFITQKLIIIVIN